MTPPPVPEAVRRQAEALGVSRESWVKLEQLVSLLLTWQSRINLISPGSVAQIWTRHVLDSLQLLAHLPPDTKTTADLGSGSGFPALPLAIATGARFHLHESNLKKAAFLREALRALDCQGVVHTDRLDGLGGSKTPVDCEVVTARALAPLPELLRLAEPFLQNGAQALFHKGEGVDQELTEAQKYWRIRFTKHASLTDSQGIILRVQEVSRV
jgi:16S rRNA (guanine527-N7)-methyltransferase